MNLEKAIEIKENHQRLHLDEYYGELLEADNLSIEALRKLTELRTGRGVIFDRLLLGETEE